MKRITANAFVMLISIASLGIELNVFTKNKDYFISRFLNLSSSNN